MIFAFAVLAICAIFALCVFGAYVDSAFLFAHEAPEPESDDGERIRGEG